MEDPWGHLDPEKVSLGTGRKNLFNLRKASLCAEVPALGPRIRPGRRPCLKDQFEDPFWCPKGVPQHLRLACSESRFVERSRLFTFSPKAIRKLTEVTIC